MAPTPQNLLLEQPAQVFWTPYDPLDLASGSLDPLGFARGYLALADRFLPTFTTVTAFPRYVSMLCAALRAGIVRQPLEGNFLSSNLRAERLRCVKSFERAWALACGLASQDAQIGIQAVQGLRGIRSVSRRLETLSNHKYAQTGSYNLLSNQVRYGSIGVYSTFLEECHLGSIQNLTLRPLGEELAEAFPAPTPELLVHEEDKNLSLAALKKWGSRAHLSCITEKEGTILATALQGGEEADHPDHVRWTSLRLLARVKPVSDCDEGTLLRHVADALRDGTRSDLAGFEAAASQLSAVLAIVEPFERFYQAALYLFECVRAAATDEGEVSLVHLGRESGVVEAATAIRQQAGQMFRSLQQSHEVNPGTAHEVEEVFGDSGLLSLAQNLTQGALGADEMLRVVVRRHEQVQSGKFDKGLPKAPWLRWPDGAARAHLTAQRYQLNPADRPGRWHDVGRHPYRTGPALAFVHACKIH